MTNDEFDRLVDRLESQARRHPYLYKLRVVLLALLGYGYLALVLALLFVLFVLSLASVAVLKALALKLVLPVLAFIWLVLRAMWVRLDPPTGLRVTRKQAPELFATIDRLRRRLKAPRFHRVLITDDFNAGVTQVPRLGVLGWHRNYLLLGLPLLKSLSVEQFEAVLAHEFGHLAGGHARLSNWLYRLRMSWQRLMHALDEQKRFGTFLFRRFFHWYAPYFAACSFPLARANEYEADATSARLVSPQAAAEALTAVNVVGSYLAERYWPTVHRAADDLPRSAFAPYAAMGERLAVDLADAPTQAWLERALARETTSDDTHPSLSDRLQALGQAPRLNPPAPARRADRLLGPALETVTATFDRRWEQTVLPAWEERYQEVQQGRARLAELETMLSRGDELTLQQAYDRACLTEAFGAGPDAALEQFHALQARAPDQAVLAYALGTRLLARDDEAGVALVQQAIAADEDLMLRGFEALRDYDWRQGRQDEAAQWHGRLMARYGLLQAAEAERKALDLRDKFDRHGLDAEQVRALGAALRPLGVRRAYLVRKRVVHMPERPQFVLGFAMTPWWGVHRKQRARALRERIAAEVDFPGATLVLNVEGDYSRFGRKFRWMRGSRIL